MRTLAGWISCAGLVCCVACGQTDAGITTAVKNKMAADDTVKAYQVDVDTQDHIVTLKGDVNTSAAKERAVQIARDTNGVRDVIDQLTVTAATSGVLDTEGPAVVAHDEVKVDANDKAGAKAVDAAKKAGRKTVDTSKKIGNKVKDAVTDDNKDTDRDGK